MPKHETGAKRDDAAPSAILEIALDQSLRLLEAEPALAEEQAREILRAFDSEARAFVILSKALRMQDDAEGALEAADNAIAIDPEIADAHLERGLSLLVLNRQDDAIGAFETVLALKPDHAPAWRTLGDALANAGQSEASARAYAQHVKAKDSAQD